MKKISAFVLATATLVCAACGGGSTRTYSIGGSVAGLRVGQQVVLSINNTETLVVGGNTNFSFAYQIPSGGNYSVTVVNQPTGQFCSVSKASGSSVTSNVEDLSIICLFSVVAKYQSGQAITAILIGNSIGCGYYAPGWEFLVTESNGKLTPQSRIDGRVRSAAIQLREKLVAANQASDLINLSASGWDTSDHLGTGRFPGVDTISDAIRLKPDVVFLPLQINDFLLYRHDFSRFKSNIRSMAQRLLDAGILPVLVKENYLLDAIAGRDFSDYGKEIEIISAEKSIPIINTYDAFRNIILSAPNAQADKNIYNDNIHPNGQGHALIFAQYRDFFSFRPR